MGIFCLLGVAWRLWIIANFHVMSVALLDSCYTFCFVVLPKDALSDGRRLCPLSIVRGIGHAVLYPRHGVGKCNGSICCDNALLSDCNG